MEHITTFLQDCKQAKYKHACIENIDAYSITPLTIDDMIKADFEKKSIIPDAGLPIPKQIFPI